MYLAKNLRYLREKNEMIQKDIAVKFGVDPVTVSTWERGKRKPDIEKIVDLASLYGVTLDKLVLKDLSQSIPVYTDKPDVEKIVHGLEELEGITQNLRIWIKKNL